MRTLRPGRGRPSLGLALALVSSTALYGGSITVAATVTPNGALFHYNYSVTNSSGDDLAVLDIVVTPGAGTIKNLSAPVGFTTAYDSVLGLASFLEDTGVFGATPISGFVFDSPLAPVATAFNATLVDGSFNVFTQGGATTGPVAPEPGYFPVLASFALFAVVIARRQRLTTRSNTTQEGGFTK